MLFLLVRPQISAKLLVRTGLSAKAAADMAMLAPMLVVIVSGRRQPVGWTAATAVPVVGTVPQGFARAGSCPRRDWGFGAGAVACLRC